MSNMDGFAEDREKAFADESVGVFTGVRCPDCEAYMERDGSWLYCLECGYDEEESNQE
jgi:exosome complex RNA-binding protein Csl4